MRLVEPDGRTLESIVGKNLASDASPNQRAEIEACIREHADGVADLARRVIADEASGKINAAVPVLIARLRKHQHLRLAHPERVANTMLDTALAAYHAKLGDYQRHHADPAAWGPSSAVEYALEAAAAHHNTTIPDTLDQQLRHQVGLA